MQISFLRYKSEGRIGILGRIFSIVYTGEDKLKCSHFRDRHIHRRRQAEVLPYQRQVHTQEKAS